MADQGYSCQRCARTDLNLTQNGRVKSHAANGRRAHPETNPHCPGGSDWPREHVRALARQGDDASAAQLMAWGEDPSGDGTADNRPTAEDVANAELVLRSAAPDEVVSAAEDTITRAAELGVQGSVHVHRFAYADDGNGHFGSFCPCGAPEPAADGPAPAADGPVATGPNPHRPPLPTGRSEALRAGWTEQQWADFQAGAPAPTRGELDQYQAAHSGVWGAPPVDQRDGEWPPRSDTATTGDGSWQDNRMRQPSSAGTTTPGPTSVQSSRLGTPASARSASNGSMRATSSGPSVAATTSTPSAQRSGSVSSDGAPATPPNEATAFLNAPAPQGGGPAMAGSNDVPRDRWGRYLIAHPRKGTVQPWTRATTVASSIADTFALSQWSQRMVAKGITLRPDLYALASGYDVSMDKDDLNSVCEQAKSAAGDKVAANLGTAMHTFTAAVDRGMEVNIPPTMVDDVNAYSAALRAYGFELVTDMIERRVALTREVAGEDIAGTFDRVYRATRDVDLTMADGEEVHVKAGTYLIGDLKTGRDLAYGWGEIAIQEAIYAHAINENGVWDADGDKWVPDPLEGAGVSEHLGIVVHLPIQKKEGAPACVLYAVDLEQGWDAIRLCVEVRKWRKAKRIAVALDVVDQAPRPAAVPAPVVDDDAAEVANRRSARELAEGKPRTAVSGYDRPTAAQLADYPSVAGQAVVQPALAIDTPPRAVRKPTWEERADAVSTKAEASAIYQEMRPHVQEIGQTRFSAVVKRMQVRLSTLVENGG